MRAWARAGAGSLGVVPEPPHRGVDRRDVVIRARQHHAKLHSREREARDRAPNDAGRDPVADLHSPFEA